MDSVYVQLRECELAILSVWFDPSGGRYVNARPPGLVRFFKRALLNTVRVSYVQKSKYRRHGVRAVNPDTPLVLPDTASITSQHWFAVIVLCPTNAVHTPTLRPSLHSESTKAMFCRAFTLGSD